MRRFDFGNIADKTEMMDSLQLGSSIRPFSLPSPLPSPNLHLIEAFSHTSNRQSLHLGLHKVLVVMWKANKLCGQNPGQ